MFDHLFNPHKYSYIPFGDHAALKFSGLSTGMYVIYKIISKNLLHNEHYTHVHTHTVSIFIKQKNSCINVIM